MIPGRERLVAYLLVNAATLLWAGNVVLGRALRESVGPWTLAALRAAAASVLFAGLLRWPARREPTAAGRREWLLVLSMAAAGVVGFQVLMYTALRTTTAVNAALVNGAGPLVTLGLSWVLLGQPLGSTQALGAALSLGGVAAVLSGGSWSALTALRFGAGDLIALAAVFLWSLYSIASRLASRSQSTVWVTAWSTLAAVPLLAVPAAVESYASPPTAQWGLAAAVLYIAVGPSFLAFLAWNEGVRRVGTNGAMAFYNTLPLYASLLSAVALGEAPGPAQMAGGALIVGGCLLATRPPRA